MLVHVFLVDLLTAGGGRSQLATGRKYQQSQTGRTGTRSINITSGHSFFSAIIAVLTHGVTLNFDNGMRLLEKIAEDIYFTHMDFINLGNGTWILMRVLD